MNILAALLLLPFLFGVTVCGLSKEIDALKAVAGLGEKAGVTNTTGENDKSAAYHFDKSTFDLIASQEAFAQADKLIHNSHDFIVSAWIKLDPKADFERQTIVSISSRNEVFFKLAIVGYRGGKRMEAIVSIKVNGGTTKEFTSRLIGIPNKWNKVTVRIQDQDNRIESLIRISRNDWGILAEPFNFKIDPYPQNAEIRLAQVYEVSSDSVPMIQDRFQGGLQDVKFFLGTNDCTPRPKCKCSDFVGTKECVMDGLRYEDGSRWTKDKCTICQCKLGILNCTNTCKVCKDNGDGQIYLHGETWKLSNDTCQTCKCEEGKTTCSLQCPKPDCSGKSGELITLKGQCCPICKEDPCLGTDKPVYKKCGCDVTCSNKEDYYNQGSSCGNSCYEGCFCKRGEVMNEKKQCMPDVRCGCTHKGKKYKVGETYSDSCEYCLCLGGRMICHNYC